MFETEALEETTVALVALRKLLSHFMLSRLVMQEGFQQRPIHETGTTCGKPTKHRLTRSGDANKQFAN